jgi:HAD superfamily hydrolase (TIGR01509 family)
MNPDSMRAVFFDLDGTLVELPDNFAGLFEAALREHDVRADEDRHEHYLEAFFDYLGECHSDPYRAAMADLRAEFDLGPSAETLAETYTRREAAATALRPGASEALDALGAGDSGDTADTVLGVLTNGGARTQHRKLEYHGIADAFDAVVVSGAVGAAKPDAEIFAAAKEAIPADEYVFVADDLERDVLPAQEAGFTGVYVPKNWEQGTESADADATLGSLHQLPDLLG